MKITREALKNIVKETMIEESEYQEFFKRALEKAGKSIPSMSDEEKKAFFNKIEKTWKGKGEKNEISETELEEAQSPAQKAAFQKMLDKKKGKDGDDDEKEEVKESIIKEEEIRWSAVENAIIKYIKYNVKVLEKPIKAKDEAGTVKMLKAFIDGLVNAQKSLKLRGNFK
jgi:FMN-dependent NADH-azoreductase